MTAYQSACGSLPDLACSAPRQGPGAGASFWRPGLRVMSNSARCEVVMLSKCVQNPVARVTKNLKDVTLRYSMSEQFI